MKSISVVLTGLNCSLCAEIFGELAEAWEKNRNGEGTVIAGHVQLKVREFKSKETGESRYATDAKLIGWQIIHHEPASF